MSPVIDTFYLDDTSTQKKKKKGIIISAYIWRKPDKLFSYTSSFYAKLS